MKTIDKKCPNLKKYLEGRLDFKELEKKGLNCNKCFGYNHDCPFYIEFLEKKYAIKAKYD